MISRRLGWLGRQTSPVQPPEALARQPEGSDAEVDEARDFGGEAITAVSSSPAAQGPTMR